MKYCQYSFNWSKFLHNLVNLIKLSTLFKKTFFCIFSFICLIFVVFDPIIRFDQIWIVLGISSSTVFFFGNGTHRERLELLALHDSYIISAKRNRLYKIRIRPLVFLSNSFPILVTKLRTRFYFDGGERFVRQGNNYRRKHRENTRLKMGYRNYCFSWNINPRKFIDCFFFRSNYFKQFLWISMPCNIHECEIATRLIYYFFSCDSILFTLKC